MRSAGPLDGRGRALAAALLLSLTTAHAEFAPNLPLDSAVDRTVWRVAARSGIALPRTFLSQPMNAADVLWFCAKADSLRAEGLLSPAESLRLARLKRRVTSQTRLFTWGDSARDIRVTGHVALLADIRPRYHDSAAVGISGIAGPSLAGNAGRISYYSGIDVWTEYRSDTLFHRSDYQPYHGVPYNLYARADSAHARSSDMPRGGVRYQGRLLDFEAAIDYLRQGPAVWYPLTFSGYAPPVTYVRARLDMGKAAYIHTLGLLRSEKDKPKYVYTHRLEAPLLASRLNLGLTEVIVNGSTTNQPGDSLRPEFRGVTRDWEWVYMIPFVPYKFTEHYAGDRDNALISFDADLRMPRAMRWYLEFLLDDMTTPWTLFSNDWGNKWAFTAGWQWFTRLRSGDVTASIEYSRVEPWVYTHFYGGSHNYAHFGMCLGSPLGPNSDAFVVEVKCDVTPTHAAGVAFTNTRKGATRGSSINDVFQDSAGYRYVDGAHVPWHDSWTTTFLGPGAARTSLLGAYLQWAPLDIFAITARVDYDVAPHGTGLRAAAYGGISL